MEPVLPEIHKKCLPGGPFEIPAALAPAQTDMRGDLIQADGLCVVLLQVREDIPEPVVPAAPEVLYIGGQPAAKYLPDLKYLAHQVKFVAIALGVKYGCCPGQPGKEFPFLYGLSGDHLPVKVRLFQYGAHTCLIEPAVFIRAQEIRRNIHAEKGGPFPQRLRCVHPLGINEDPLSCLDQIRIGLRSPDHRAAKRQAELKLRVPVPVDESVGVAGKFTIISGQRKVRDRLGDLLPGGIQIDLLLLHRHMYYVAQYIDKNGQIVR